MRNKGKYLSAPKKLFHTKSESLLEIFFFISGSFKVSTFSDRRKNILHILSPCGMEWLFISFSPYLESCLVYVHVNDDIVVCADPMEIFNKILRTHRVEIRKINKPQASISKSHKTACGFFTERFLCVYVYSCAIYVYGYPRRLPLWCGSEKKRENWRQSNDVIEDVKTDSGRPICHHNSYRINV